MSRQVLFNGVILTRPGAYTKVDASQFQNVPLLGLGVVGLIGEADQGPPQVVNIFTDAAAVKSTYKSGDLVEAAAMAASPGDDDIIVAGAQTLVCYKVNNGTQASLTHDTLTFTSLDYGIPTNSTQVAITTTGGNFRTVQIQGLDVNGNLVTQTSPQFGSPSTYGKFSIQYTGGGSVATMTITATTLTTTVTGDSPSNLSITFANYQNLAQILFFIAGFNGGVYTVTTLITNAQSFLPANLDAITAQDIKTSTYTAMANNFDLSNWVNTNSSLVSCTMTQGQTGPRSVLTLTALSGGTLGISANTDWANAFTAISGIKVNQVVPLVSSDGTGSNTYTISSITAALATHCQLMSSTSGKNEREGWASLHGTKTALITAAQGLNIADVTLCGQQLTRLSAVTATLTQFPEWSLATVLASMRAGAPLGEPLTHKFINATAIANDSSWSTTTAQDLIDLLLNGIIFVTNVQGQGFRIEKGITTYTKSNNDAFIEESIVQGWKLIAFTWRTALENQYTGRPMDVGIVQTVKPFSAGILRQLRDDGAIADSIVNGVQTPGFSNIQVTASNDILSVSGQVSPTSGINFILNTMVLVPAQFSLSS